jgi:peptide/nickel transport system ATP-binding protein
MYLGKIVELADRDSLYKAPMHPYTKALMSAVPIPDPRRRAAKSERILLKGDVPSPISPPSGCRFHTRCWKATEICKTTEPPLAELKPGQQVACHHPENFEDQAPQDTVLLSAAREAVELVPEAVLEKSAETSAAVAAEVSESTEASKPTGASEAAAASEPTEASKSTGTSEAAAASESTEASKSTGASEAAEASEPTEASEPVSKTDGAGESQESTGK